MQAFTLVEMPTALAAARINHAVASGGDNGGGLLPPASLAAAQAAVGEAMAQCLKALRATYPFLRDLDDQDTLPQLLGELQPSRARGGREGGRKQYMMLLAVLRAWVGVGWRGGCRRVQTGLWCKSGSDP